MFDFIIVGTCPLTSRNRMTRPLHLHKEPSSLLAPCPLSSVGAHVRGQVAGLRERPSACLARVGLGARVGAHVLGQVAGLRELRAQRGSATRSIRARHD